MTYTFCTLFDKNYLSRGLALYQSLIDHCDDFVLWVLCMDDSSYAILDRMRLDRVELIRLEEFEDNDLRNVKQTRSVAEYCWTCTAPLILYVMSKSPGAAHVAYLDADLLFYSDPGPVYDELDDNSILIVPHRYGPRYQGWEASSGIYNVSVVIFRNDSEGVKCLTWWRERCLEVCTLDPERGYCGDQKYLDDWPTRFRNVVVLRHKGGGLAPWNIADHQLSRRNGNILVDTVDLIFYHFHSLQIGESAFLSKRPIIASRGYGLTRQHLSTVYTPYARELRKAIKRVRQVDPSFASGYTKLSLREMASAFRRGNLLLA